MKRSKYNPIACSLFEKVKLIAYEDDVYKCLSEILMSSQDPVPSDSKPLHPKKSYCPPSVQRKQRRPQTVTFCIHARTEKDVQAVKAGIRGIIKANYAEKDERNSCLEYVDDEDVAKLLKQASSMAIVDLGKDFETPFWDSTLILGPDPV